MNPKPVPAVLTDHILPFHWDVDSVWKLGGDVLLRPRADYDYLLDLPLWSSVPRQGMLYDISPREVMFHPGRSPHQAERIRLADTRHPLDFLMLDGRTWILDGVHRLARHYQMGTEFIGIRLHPESVIASILTKEH